MTPPRHGRIARAAMALPLLLLIPPLRHILEASMLTHMLVEFPLLFIAGWLAGGWLTHHRLPAGLPAVVDAHGLLGLALASCVGALWMIPSMLDLSLLDASVQASKYASWTLCGLLFRSSWKRAGPVVSAFFLGNTGWMLATAGLLYQEAQQRLCVSYLLDEQLITGRGLVALAILIGAFAITCLVAPQGWVFNPRDRGPSRARAPAE
ncbi:MAG: hypothetical protein KF710_02815 [Rhodocyclaceae bacterium]|nr:hypothetical protein [Rhodocyclaceae bacterium]